MQVTANAGDRKLVAGSLARPTIEKRRSLNWDVHSSKECIPKKAAPAVSPIASGEVKRRLSSEPATAVGPSWNSSIDCIAGVCMRYACA
jgi:hypothetical protein